MRLPKSLSQFQKKADSYLNANKIGEIEYSGGTYQIQLFDGKSEEWAFLQLGENGALKDSFCSCESEGNCEHIAAALLIIYRKRKRPLHVRFEESLWNQLCQIYAERSGFSCELLKKGKDVYEYQENNTSIFSIKAKTNKGRDFLKEVIEQREEESEETSIKFSNLSSDDIQRWREGKPSLSLQYELSLWSDIAKKCMLLQESGCPYKIEFTYDKEKWPDFIFISFEDFDLKFHLTKSELELVVPSLTTVKSPLKAVYPQFTAIDAIVYDKELGELVIHSEGQNQKDLEEEMMIGGWVYRPYEGFFFQENVQLLSMSKLTGKQIAQVLNEQFDVIEKKLKNVQIHKHPIKAHCSISFDDQWNLHINTYLFEPGDLLNSYSRQFGDWVYLDNDGFYRLEEKLFDEIETIIPKEEVADFIQQKRTWLHAQPGFETHVAKLETEMVYNVTSKGRLTFTTGIRAGSAEFGPWVYVKDQGFYKKKNVQVNLPIQPGTTINHMQIPLFIRSNKEELKLLPGFYSEICPVQSSGLLITVTENDLIFIEPKYELWPEYEDVDVRFFDEFVFIEGEGFSEMPGKLRLPERYRHPVQISQDNIDFFIQYELKNIIPFTIFIDQKLIEPKDISLIADEIKLHEEGYELHLRFASEKGSFTLSEFWPKIKSKSQYFFSKAGLIDLSNDRFNWIRSLPKKQLDRRGNQLVLSTLELIRLNAFDSIKALEGQEHLDELTKMQVKEKPDLTNLKSELRPYQSLGVQWLWFLYWHKLSGLLCDEMGLGKTHQAMALIAACQKLKDRDKSKFLVICPTSVIYHWEEKLKQFLPHLRVNTYHGLDRSLKEFDSEYDLLLTSYGIWRQEHKFLTQIPFEVAVFDEIQTAKNKSSILHTSLLKVNAKMRLGLTGTPIENRLRELKSLFDLVLPFYMLSEAEYKKFFIKPIEQRGDQERKVLLTRYIKPFVLRRKKQDVLFDLPEKTEEIFHCDLSDDQKRLYSEVLAQSREPIMQELKNDKGPIPFMHIFAILAHLKQICNHPASYLKRPHEYENYTSGKWDLFVELLSEARESGQKVVVFSQYLTMLDIFELYLKEHGIGFATIRGATKERGKEVKRFNTDPNCEVFLGSLQAAGWGIDLTAASVVIHYDRWWNAAREDQATDRVHRIGQTRGVEVFKFVTKNTFEERIDTLIKKKGKLMEDVVGIDDHRFMKKFDRQEIMKLLQDVGSLERESKHE